MDAPFLCRHFYRSLIFSMSYFNTWILFSTMHIVYASSCTISRSLQPSMFTCDVTIRLSSGGGMGDCAEAGSKQT